jgi:3-keto-disaccharide hydrolase
MASVSLALLFTTLLAPASAQEGGWRTILDANSPHPKGWTHVGAGEFVLENGEWKTVSSPDGLGLFVFTGEKIGNCQLKVVFKAEDEHDNSGVYIRIAEDPEGKMKAKSTGTSEGDSDADIGAWWGVHHGYEVQISEAGDPPHRTGAIYSLASGAELPPKKSDGWRTMIITLDGPRVKVEVDGKPISMFDSSKPGVPPRKIWYEPKREPIRPEAGYIGLQNHDPGDVVYFKEVSVRPLSK